jgi:hypothetical protein
LDTNLVHAFLVHSSLSAIDFPLPVPEKIIRGLSYLFIFI